MKLFKKMLGLAVSAAMVLSMGIVPASADPTTYTLTVQDTKADQEYVAYQIFTGDYAVVDNDKVLTNIQWGNGVDGTVSQGNAEGIAKGLTSVPALNTFIEDTLTGHLQNPISTTGSNPYVFEGLASGYYLVKNNTAADDVCIVKVVGDNVTTAPKSGAPTFTKKVKDINDSTGATVDWNDTADMDIGDEVEFKLEAVLAENIANYTSYKLVFNDTMSKGLSFVTGSLNVYVNEINDSNKISADKYSTGSGVTTNGDGTKNFAVTIPDVKNLGVDVAADTKIIVTYKATLNGDAVLGSAGNPNTASLTYSNNSSFTADGETSTTPDDKVKVFTYKVVINKTKEDGTTALNGAEFKLEKISQDGRSVLSEISRVTGTADSVFEFNGLDDGYYRLTETKAPAGYNGLATPIEFKVEATHEELSNDPQLSTLTGTQTSGEITFTADKTAGSLTANVKNNKGPVLPETGGMGTRVIYMLGAALVVVASVLLITKRRMSVNK